MVECHISPLLPQLANNRDGGSLHFKLLLLRLCAVAELAPQDPAKGLPTNGR